MPALTGRLSPTRERMWMTLACLAFYMGHYSASSLVSLRVVELSGSHALVGAVVGRVGQVALVARWVAGVSRNRFGSALLMLVATVSLAMAGAVYMLASGVSWVAAGTALQGLALGLFATAGTTHVASAAASTSQKASALSLYTTANLVASAAAPGIALALANAAGAGTAATMTLVVATMASLLLLRLPLKLDRSLKSQSIRVSLHAVPAALSDRPFIGASALYLAWAVSYGAVLAFLPLYGKYRGIPNVGAFFAAYSIATIMGRALLGRILPHMTMKVLLNASAAMAAASMVLLSTAGDPLTLALAGALYGLGSFPLYPCLASIASSRVPDSLAMAMALFMSNYDVGQIIGTTGLGILAVPHGYQWVYRAAAAAILLGLIACDLLMRHHREHDDSCQG